VNISLVQLNIAWEEQVSNYKRVEALLENACPLPGSIVALPELFSTGYTMRSKVFEEQLSSGATMEFLKTLARRYEVFILGTLILSASDNQLPTNSAIVVSPQGEILSRYDKTHLLPVSGEPQAYTPGAALTSFQTDGMSFGVLICYDLRFPELFRIFYDQVVDGIFVVANWPALRQLHWETLIRARAIENQCYVFAVNRVGSDPSSTYQGGTSVISPTGEILSVSYKEEVVSCSIDPMLAKEAGRQFPISASRNFSLYQKYAPYSAGF
jgi:predicted amidohydrolase